MSGESVSANHLRDGYPENLQDSSWENLAFEGGGAKGIAYVGVLRFLEKHDMLEKFKRFAGTSVGAIAATLLAIGCHTEEVRIYLSEDMDDIIMDSRCGTCSIIPNFLCRYGWNPGREIQRWIEDIIEKKTGERQLTFKQLYEMKKKELCIPVTNLNNLAAVYCHVKTTPDMPICIAVRMSISIPGVFQPVKYKMYNHVDYYVDGALLCNYPIRCFDGHWLDMSHLDFRGPENEHNTFPKINENRFYPRNDKTLGVLLYTEQGAEAFKGVFEDRAHGGKNVDKTLKEQLESFLRKNKPNNPNIELNMDEDSSNTDESLGLLSGEKGKHLLDQLTAEESVIRYSELMEFLCDEQVNPWQVFLSYKRQNITNVGNYIKRIYETLTLCTKAVHTEDIPRTIAINTGVVETMSFKMSDDEIEELAKKGEKASEDFFKFYGYMPVN